MDSTHTALRRVPARARVGGPYAELTNDYRSNAPIYAQLVAEWRAEGRVIPERRDVRTVLWATFAAPAPQTEADVEAAEPVPAVPVPRGLPGWVRVTPH
ncbi:hypothetical protein [Streptomyces sp. NBC_00996]|uniref:hypothetical protein n=1 Tax=Streptomyces sp. NBC_00996 TaxID=2903710 RepID=UPI003865C6CF|nr:hypothetical protein OG390_47715 [Streptomyces sp. NBC_00996]